MYYLFQLHVSRVLDALLGKMPESAVTRNAMESDR